MHAPNHRRLKDGWSHPTAHAVTSRGHWLGTAVSMGRTTKRYDNNVNKAHPMEPETSKNIAYLLGFITLALMVWFISRQAMNNRTAMLDKAAPKVAGEDELEGGARNPQQFDEPDEDALEEMAALLGEDSEDEA
jgi:hypothetical protein